VNSMEMDAIVEAIGRDILRFCRVTAGNRQDGDDLYQDTMLTLLEKWERLGSVENMKSYAISVAIRLWKNRNRKFLRRSRLAPQESLEALTEQGIHPGEAAMSPEEALLHRQQTALVRSLVQKLPDAYRLPITLYYSAGLSVAGIAQVLKVPENTVKSRLHRARKIIRTKLEEMEYEGSEI